MCNQATRTRTQLVLITRELLNRTGLIRAKGACNNPSLSVSPFSPALRVAD